MLRLVINSMYALSRISNICKPAVTFICTLVDAWVWGGVHRDYTKELKIDPGYDNSWLPSCSTTSRDDEFRD